MFHLNGGNDLATVLISAICIRLLVKQLFSSWGKDTILNLEYCIVACFLEFIIISNIIRTLKICKNVRYFMKLSVESYRILEIYCIFAAVMTFNKR